MSSDKFDYVALGDVLDCGVDLEADGCEVSSLEAIMALGVVASGFFRAPAAPVVIEGRPAYNAC